MQVRQFYTAPTLLRSLLQLGDAWPRQSDLSSLRILASAGEPMNDHAWHWFNEVIGGSRCPVVDTWWQTETGNGMITPQPGAWFNPKPGAAGVPFFGVQPVVLEPTTGKEMPGKYRFFPGNHTVAFPNHSEQLQEKNCPFFCSAYFARPVEPAFHDFSPKP